MVSVKNRSLVMVAGLPLAGFLIYIFAFYTKIIEVPPQLLLVSFLLLMYPFFWVYSTNKELKKYAPDAPHPIIMIIILIALVLISLMLSFLFTFVESTSAENIYTATTVVFSFMILLHLLFYSKAAKVIVKKVHPFLLWVLLMPPLTPIGMVIIQKELNKIADGFEPDSTAEPQ